MTDRRRAIAFNALSRALRDDHWLPFTVRQAAVDAVLIAVDRDATRQTTGQDDSDHYDARLTAPMTTEAAAALRDRIETDTLVHRAVGQPDPAVVEQFIQHMANEHPAATHCCTNCDGIDPDTCLTNPHRAPAVGQPAEAHDTDYDRDPAAIAWARTKIQDEIDRCRKFHTSATEAGQPEQAEMWQRLANRMESTFMGGSGCVIAYFDERLPVHRQAGEGER